MGTHISKVKSVDLDSWTDEQLQSVLKWGNARANKYWEAKLAPGHQPAEAKIENFIRTKYESKRWVSDGGIPDPSTLDIEDDDVPLKKVQEKVQIERSASQRLASGSSQPPPRQAAPQPAIDLFGDDTPAVAPPRASTGPPASRAVPPKAEPVPPKQTKAGDSLLGLDFLGGGASAQPARPSSTGPATTAPSRPDLKQSILSLYASAPKPAPQPQAQQQHARQESFGGLGTVQTQQSPQQSQFGGLNDAFSSLNFNAPPAAKPSPFSGLDSFSSTKSPPSNTSSNLFGGGGGFFDSTPKPTPASQAPKQSSGGFGDFSAFSSPAATSTAPSKPATSSYNDLLDFSMPAAAPPSQPKPAAPQATSPPFNSAFNLSSPTSQTAPKAAPAPAAAPNYSGFSNMDAWGSTDAWASTAPSQPAAPAAPSHTQTQPKSSGGWGSTPAITQDDDFGGWSSAAPSTTQTQTQKPTNASKPAGGFGGGDDLFSNVWE